MRMSGLPLVAATLRVGHFFRAGRLRAEWQMCGVHDAVGNFRNSAYAVFTKQSLGLRLCRLPRWLRPTQQVLGGRCQHKWPGSTVSKALFFHYPAFRNNELQIPCQDGTVLMQNAPNCRARCWFHLIDCDEQHKLSCTNSE